MKRSVSALLFTTLIVLLVCDCDSSGGSSAIPPIVADNPADFADHPTAGGWDPFASGSDLPQSPQDFVGCAMQPTATPAQILTAIVGPLCSLAETCGPTIGSQQAGDAASDQAVPQEGGNPTEAGPVQDAVSEARTNDAAAGDAGPGGGLSPMGLTFGPDECRNLLSEQSIASDFQVTDPGYVGLCQIITAMVDRIAQHPECTPPLEVPSGVCVGAVQSCLADIAALGCAPSSDLLAPASCRDLKFGTSAQDSPPLQDTPSSGDQ